MNVPVLPIGNVPDGLLSLVNEPRRVFRDPNADRTIQKANLVTMAGVSLRSLHFRGEDKFEGYAANVFAYHANARRCESKELDCTEKPLAKLASKRMGKGDSEQEKKYVK